MNFFRANIRSGYRVPSYPAPKIEETIMTWKIRYQKDFYGRMEYITLFNKKEMVYIPIETAITGNIIFYNLTIT